MSKGQKGALYIANTAGFSVQGLMKQSELGERIDLIMVVCMCTCSLAVNGSHTSVLSNHADFWSGRILLDSIIGIHSAIGCTYIWLAWTPLISVYTPAIANGAYRDHGVNPCSPQMMECYIALEVYINRVYFIYRERFH